MRAPHPVVVVHGGAGDVPVERHAEAVEGCRRAARAGLEVLLAGGSALDAAQRAVEVLEDDPLFNAGTGACLTEAGEIELDASVMEGTGLRAGAVAALPPFRNPVRIARAVLEEGRHVMMSGPGAAAFARSMGFEPADPESMITEASRRRLETWKQGRAEAGWAGGTVGAVACDASGRLAAATSTGGRVGKRPGRVGDSPVPGAGTFADDEAGACSCTGDGEAILRVGLARLAVDLLRVGLHADEAARAAIATLGRRVGGTGGLVLLDRRGRFAACWNTRTMSHAVARAGQPVVGDIVAPLQDV
ncbi:MAG: isoaspartyl peptidase/L-asparaginase [Myxococcota bacterium]|nr:isoaspartyl peptidase/L-asparaginase [Myxococcota bacterium]MDW8362160.1 isoaspartyl peptidase/L-asparaginase [Myxococcales bacterium]